MTFLHYIFLLCLCRETVHIEIEDVNEYAPAPEQDSYMVDVVEGKLFDEILRLRAPDRDGSVGYKTICHYHILTPNVPFRIDNEGEKFGCNCWKS